MTTEAYQGNPRLRNVRIEVGGTARQIMDGCLDIHWREDGWIGLDPSIVAHPYVEEAKEYAEEVMA